MMEKPTNWDDWTSNERQDYLFLLAVGRDAFAEASKFKQISCRVVRACEQFYDQDP